MTTKTHLCLAAKYLVYITIFITLAFGIFSLLSTQMVIDFDSLIGVRGVALIGMLVIFSLLQPLWAYTTQTLNFDATRVTDKVTEILDMSGYELVHHSEGESGNGLLVFRYKSTTKRIIGGYATNGIRITTIDGVSTIKGARRDVTPVMIRLRGMIK